MFCLVGSIVLSPGAEFGVTPNSEASGDAEVEVAGIVTEGVSAGELVERGVGSLVGTDIGRGVGMLPVKNVGRLVVPGEIGDTVGATRAPA